MNLTFTRDEGKLVVVIEGSIDTVTAPQLEVKLRDGLAGVTHLTLDFAQVDYISSAGLRVLLGANQTMEAQGEMVILHVNEDVREVFEMTGFDELLTVE